MPLRAAGNELVAAADLRAEVRQAREGGYPLVILYSRKDCRYCETVRRDYLRPMMAAERYRQRVVVRQINQDSEAPLLDFAGKPTTHADFARQEKIKLVPVVAFYGSGGKAMAEPIVGTRIPDFYPGYLESALQAGVR